MARRRSTTVSGIAVTKTTKLAARFKASATRALRISMHPAAAANGAIIITRRSVPTIVNPPAA